MFSSIVGLLSELGLPLIVQLFQAWDFPPSRFFFTPTVLRRFPLLSRQNLSRHR
jgi:hypothetical protein